MPRLTATAAPEAARVATMAMAAAAVFLALRCLASVDRGPDESFMCPKVRPGAQEEVVWLVKVWLGRPVTPEGCAIVSG